MRFDARVEVEKELNNMGLIRGKEPNKMRLGLCYRTKDIIEPLLRPQWYFSYEYILCIKLYNKKVFKLPRCC